MMSRRTINNPPSVHLYLVLTRSKLCPPPSTHQNNPQTPQVTGLVVAIVFEYLWRGVLQREAGSLQELIVRRFEASKAEVYDFDLGVLALVREEQVLPGNTRRQSFLNWTSRLV